jgi:hypothetical protein
MDDAAPAVIFLDIDGVLNRTTHATHIRLDADLMERLGQLVEDTGASIVLSTFWRHFSDCAQFTLMDSLEHKSLPTSPHSRGCATRRADIRYVFHRHGLPAESIIGKTPGTSGASSLSSESSDPTQYSSRASEIRAWLRENPKVTRFAILDDRPSAADEVLAPYFVQTDAMMGLSPEDAARCAALLCPSPRESSPGAVPCAEQARGHPQNPRPSMGTSPCKFEWDELEWVGGALTSPKDRPV